MPLMPYILQAWVVLTAPYVSVEYGQQDYNNNKINSCDEISFQMSIQAFSREESIHVCTILKRVLEGVRVSDLRNFEKATLLLSTKGYKKGQFEQITSELVEIVRLRGLYDKPEKWRSTLELVWRVWSGWDGILGPDTIISLLRNSGEASQTLSDEGLIAVLAAMKYQYRKGN